jgi:hypothetical protein
MIQSTFSKNQSTTIPNFLLSSSTKKKREKSREKTEPVPELQEEETKLPAENCNL